MGEFTKVSTGSTSTLYNTAKNFFGDFFESFLYDDGTYLAGNFIKNPNYCLRYRRPSGSDFVYLSCFQLGQGYDSLTNTFSNSTSPATTASVSADFFTFFKNSDKTMFGLFTEDNTIKYKKQLQIIFNIENNWYNLLKESDDSHANVLQEILAPSYPSYGLITLSSGQNIISSNGKIMRCPIYIYQSGKIVNILPFLFQTTLTSDKNTDLPIIFENQQKIFFPNSENALPGLSNWLEIDFS